MPTESQRSGQFTGTRSFSFWGFLVSSWTRRPSEDGFDLLQRLAFGLRDEGDGEDDVDGTHGGEQPEGTCAGQEVLEEVTVTSHRTIRYWKPLVTWSADHEKAEHRH